MAVPILPSSSFQAGIPQGLSTLIMECISTRPAKRPADMEAVIQRLEVVKYRIQKERDPSAAIRLPDPQDSGHGVSGSK